MKKTFLSCLAMILIVVATASGQSKNEVKNVIFMIGDGMGLAQVSSTILAIDTATLALERAQYVGLAKTYSTNSKVTDSAASGTALATGTKTYNGAIGVDVDKKPLVSILKLAENNGLATGLVATYSITNATPASFIANVESRKMEQEIALDFLKTDIDLFIGGGRDMFEKRDDKRNLTNELSENGYQIAYTLDDLKNITKGKIAALLAGGHLPKMSKGRGNYLPEATAKALEVLKTNSDKGFFVMIEGSMIDGGGHANDLKMVIDETIDFDHAIRLAFDFADRNPGTLVVVTADHETGGLSIPNVKENKVIGKFSTIGHTGIMVPVYAYGAGAENFTGIMENTDIPKKIIKLLNLDSATK